MTPMPMQEAPSAPPAPSKIPQSESIALGRIIVKSNIRKAFDANALKELAADIRTHGVINPITVRPIPGGDKFELVAGERRLRAAKEAGLFVISAIVRELTDQQALEVQTAENIHRQDLTPIEEARGFKMLLDARRYDVAQLAQLINKSRLYVHRTVKLLELPKAMIEAIDAGELSAAHGHQVLRVPAEDRGAVWKWIKKDMTALALGKLIDENAGRDLKHVAWEMMAPFAGMPACSGCPSNSTNQKDLFDGASAGKCLNGGCFDKKQGEMDRLVAADLTKKYPTVKLVAPAQEYEIESKHKVTDLPPAIAAQKKIQEAIKANPDHYVVAMVKETDWTGGKSVTKLVPRVFVKESAKKDVLKVIGKDHGEAYKFGGGYSTGGSSRPSITPKQRAIRRAWWKAWMVAATKIDVSRSKPALKTILDKLTPGHYETKIPQEVIPVAVRAGQYHGQVMNYDKLTTEQMMSLILLFALDTHELEAASFKALGIKTDELKAAAIKTATAEWDAKKK